MPKFAFNSHLHKITDYNNPKLLKDSINIQRTSAKEKNQEHIYTNSECLFKASHQQNVILSFALTIS